MDNMKDKTRVLVTHAVDYLHLCDRIIVMKEGRVVIEGAYQDIKHTSYIKDIMQIHEQGKEQVESQLTTNIQDTQ